MKQAVCRVGLRAAALMMCHDRPASRTRVEEWTANLLPQDTVLFLPYLSEMTLQQIQGEFAWAAFPGGRFRATHEHSMWLSAAAIPQMPGPEPNL